MRWRGTSCARTLGPWLLATYLGTVAVPGSSARAQDPGAPTSFETAGDVPILTDPIQTALDSTFGPADYRPWRPLPLKTLFSEGWDEAWIAPPNGSGGAPRQGWINAADGNFYRLWFFSYTFINHLSQGSNGHLGGYTLYTPLSRRLQLVTFVPFVVAGAPPLALSKQGFFGTGLTSRTGGVHSPTGFGDMAFTPRVMLAETQDFSLSAQVTVQTPTGTRGVGAGQTIVTPGIQFWSDVGSGWAVRGGFSSAVATNRAAGGTILVSQLAVGQTITPHDTPLIGDFTYYLSANVFNDLAIGKTTATLTPGFRTHVGNDWYFLGGIDVPVTGRRPFEESATVWIMKVF